MAATPPDTIHLVEVPDQRIVAGGVAILLGGILVVLQGLVLLEGSEVLASFGLSQVQDVQSLGGLAIVLGLILISFALVVWSARVRRRTETALMVLILSLASLPVGGGFLVGMALGLTGGLLILSVPKGPHFVLVPSSVEMCSACGYPNLTGFQNCTECGVPLD